MKHVTIRTTHDLLQTVLARAKHEPVTIEQDGIPVAVVVSPEDYLMLEALENAYLEQCEAEFTMDSLATFDAENVPVSPLVN